MPVTTVISSLILLAAAPPPTPPPAQPAPTASSTASSSSTAAPWSAPAAAPKQKLVVMPIQSSDLQPRTLITLDELLAAYVRRLGAHEVIAKSDVEAMLGLESMKDRMGCDDIRCAADIGGALGAELLLAGRVGRLGTSIIVVLKLINTQKQAVVGSVTQKAADDENLYDKAIEAAAAGLFELRTEQAAIEAPKPAAPPRPVEAISDTKYRSAEWSFMLGAGSSIPIIGGEQSAKGVQGRQIKPGFSFRAERVAASGLSLAIAGTVLDTALRFGGDAENAYFNGSPPAGVFELSQMATGTFLGYVTGDRVRLHASLGVEVARVKLSAGEPGALMRAQESGFGIGADGAFVFGFSPELLMEARITESFGVALRAAYPVRFYPALKFMIADMQLMIVGAVPNGD